MGSPEVDVTERACTPLMRQSREAGLGCAGGVGPLRRTWAAGRGAGCQAHSTPRRQLDNHHGSWGLIPSELDPEKRPVGTARTEGCWVPTSPTILGDSLA